MADAKLEIPVVDNFVEKYRSIDDEYKLTTGLKNRSVLLKGDGDSTESGSTGDLEADSGTLEKEVQTDLFSSLSDDFVIVRKHDVGIQANMTDDLQPERRCRINSCPEETEHDEEDLDMPSPIYNKRRGSWWNVLTDKKFLKNRSRRGSQQLIKSSETFELPHRRSKSRSVDHGFTAPFDLETLRLKVEERFDGINKDGVPAVKTIMYTVRDRDTLTSLAARFETTPSELTKLNRLGTPFIFAGQTLQVPDRRKERKKTSESSDGTDADRDAESGHELPLEKELLDTLRPDSPDPNVTVPARFLKINVRHITDGQGVVSGVLLVTPNAVMFDPNVSDTLVMEHGAEAYGVIAPMEFVVNAAIYHDIAHMRTPHSDYQNPDAAEIYYSKVETRHALIRKSINEEDIEEDSQESKESPNGMESLTESTASTREDDQTVPVKDQETVLQKDSEHEVPSNDIKRPEDNECKGQGDNKIEVREAKPNNLSTDGDKERKFENAERPHDDKPKENLTCAERQNSVIKTENELPKVKEGETLELPSQQQLTLKITREVKDETKKPLTAPITKVSLDPPLSAPPLSSAEQREGAAKTDKKNKMLKRLSYPLTWMEGLSGDGSQNSQSESLSTSTDSGHVSSGVFSKVFSRRSSLGGFGKSSLKSSSVSSTQPRLDYRSMVSMDDMPELFASFEKLLPRPAQPSDDPPLYLRLRMGRPMSSTKILPHTTPLMSYGRKRMKPEYWFGVPRNRVDDLYKFLNHWMPEIYGPLDPETVTKRGYELIYNDTDWDEDENRNKNQKAGSPNELPENPDTSWEVLSVSEEVRRALYSSCTSMDLDLYPPDLIGESEILTIEHRRELCKVLPARAQGYMWSLIFSTSQHGFSLSSMYRKMTRVDSPVLLLIQDTDHNIFGAITSCALHPSEHFYGTGESLLFSFKEDGRMLKQDGAIVSGKECENKVILKYYQWTGENMYFIRGNNDNISIGAGDGRFGIWLDGDLYQGRTQECTTYGNEPLSTREDFIVQILECWSFI